MSESVITGAISTSEGVITGAISTSESVITGAIAALNNLSVSDVADAVWNAILAGYSIVGSAGAILAAAGGGSSPTVIAAAVWNYLVSDNRGWDTYGGIVNNMFYMVKNISNWVNQKLKFR
jgi:hypothetical protein